jgi:DNA-binding transcriptional ArsR family regulator
LIDRIRQEIQERLEQLLAEAEKLRDALAALDPREQKPATRRTQRSTTRSTTRSTSPARSTASTGARSRRAASTGSSSRTAPGATKNAVLAALDKGGAMTAGEVASATGLGRGTVSTTLSKLAKSGVVVKADRGYKLPDGAKVGVA